MSNYTKIYDGAALDTAAATVSGADFDVEFNALQTSDNSKVDKESTQTITGAKILSSASNIIAGTFTGDITGDVVGNVVGNVTGNLTGNADTATSATTATSVTGTGVITATHLAANSVAASEIAAGAVGASEIAAGAVHTSELNTSTSSVSTTSSKIDFTMTGGMYIFSPQIRVSNASYSVYLHGGSSASSYANTLSQSSSFVSSMAIGLSSIGATAYAQWRYIAASPPHDMGDGDIPAFIFAVIDNTTQEVESIAFAEEPVWLANGPTDAMPVLWRGGKKFKHSKDIPASFAALSVVERMIAISKLPDVEVEITNNMVHADMDLIPHPFHGGDLAGKTVVMLDPVSEVVRQLSELDKAGEDVHAIIRDKYIKIGNTHLNRVTPAGLLIPETTWKRAV